jgi:hypothetical protein
MDDALPKICADESRVRGARDEDVVVLARKVVGDHDVPKFALAV